jgi:putative transposase
VRCPAVREVTLQVPKLRSLPFEIAIIEGYRWRETSVEEALIEMYLAGMDSVGKSETSPVCCLLFRQCADICSVAHDGYGSGEDARGKSIVKVATFP